MTWKTLDNQQLVLIQRRGFNIDPGDLQEPSSPIHVAMSWVPSHGLFSK